MNMYTWLSDELATIKSKKFHLTHEEEVSLERSFSPKFFAALPHSYTTFLSQFGGVHLYRKSNYYLVTVFPRPKKIVSTLHQELVYIGHSAQHGNAYFVAASIKNGEEIPVYEIDADDESPTMQRGAENFAEWIDERCRESREKYSKRELENIVNPVEFNAAEDEIIKSRSLFQWRVIGIDSSQNILLHIKNNSSMTLPYLTIGVRRKTGSEIGLARISVANISPGEEKEISQDMYKKIISPQTIELYSLPDPEPEDRELYWEFR